MGQEDIWRLREALARSSEDCAEDLASRQLRTPPPVDYVGDFTPELAQAHHMHAQEWLFSPERVAGPSPLYLEFLDIPTVDEDPSIHVSPPALPPSPGASPHSPLHHHHGKQPPPPKQMEMQQKPPKQGVGLSHHQQHQPAHMNQSPPASPASAGSPPFLGRRARLSSQSSSASTPSPQHTPSPVSALPVALLSGIIDRRIHAGTTNTSNTNMPLSTLPPRQMTQQQQEADWTATGNKAAVTDLVAPDEKQQKQEEEENKPSKPYFKNDHDEDHDNDEQHDQPASADADVDTHKPTPHAVRGMLQSPSYSDVPRTEPARPMSPLGSVSTITASSMNDSRTAEDIEAKAHKRRFQQYKPAVEEQDAQTQAQTQAQAVVHDTVLEQLRHMMVGRRSKGNVNDDGGGGGDRGGPGGARAAAAGGVLGGGTDEKTVVAVVDAGAVENEQEGGQQTQQHKEHEEHRQLDTPMARSDEPATPPRGPPHPETQATHSPQHGHSSMDHTPVTPPPRRLSGSCESKTPSPEGKQPMSTNNNSNNNNHAHGTTMQRMAASSRAKAIPRLSESEVLQRIKAAVLAKRAQEQQQRHGGTEVAPSHHQQQQQGGQSQAQSQSQSQAQHSSMASAYTVQRIKELVRKSRSTAQAHALAQQQAQG